MDGWTEAGAQASPHTVARSVRSVLAWPLPGDGARRSLADSISIGGEFGRRHKLRSTEGTLPPIRTGV